MGEFDAESLNEAILIDIVAPDVTVEVAIGALREAERPVDVNAEARVESISNRRHFPLSHETAQNAGPEPLTIHITGG
jgi:hypothetical protein